MNYSFQNVNLRLIACAWAVFTMLGLTDFANGQQEHRTPFVKGNWRAPHMKDGTETRQRKRGPPNAGEPTVPLVITNRCDSTIWPGLATQSGTGPGTGGFELVAGKSKKMRVGWNWQGRIWGRTNCTVNGESCACQTGDCFAKLDCEFSVSDLDCFRTNTNYTREPYQLHLSSLTSLVVWA